MRSRFVSLFIVSVTLCISLSAQQSGSTTPDQNSTSQKSQDQSSPNQNTTTPPNSNGNDQSSSQKQSPPTANPGQVPTYRITVVERSTEAVDYRDRGGTTQVDFRGTSLMPKVEGKAKVTGHTGRLRIDADLRGLQSPRTFGPEYLTYVLWAITPEGRATNLGEVIPKDDGNARLQVTSALQAFGLIVTAEPYFAVSRPGNLVVAENVVRQDTAGGIHPITAKFDLIEKGQYAVNLTPEQLPSITADKDMPLQLLEAENAVVIAKAAGAGQYAADTLEKAKLFLSQGRDYYRRKQGTTPIGAVSRAATQSAEDARLLTMQRKQQEATAAERQKSQERIQAAKNEAEQQSARAAAAQEDAKRQAEQRELAEQERMAAQQARIEAEQAAQQAAQDRAAAQQQLQEAEQARQAAVQQQQALSAQAEQARLQAQQSEQARVQTQQQAEQQRQRLLAQLNEVLQTRDSARGLIVNMSDVLFDLDKATLRQGAKLRLAKVAGIILAYPDLRLEIDGFTDNTGSPEYNQGLSEKRAASVKEFLVLQGVNTSNIITKGFGQESPVATNDTAAGRQMNRRVELVVSGTAIGRNITPGASSSTPGTSSVGGVNSTGQTTATPPASSTVPAASQPAGTPGVSGPGTVSTPAAPSVPASGTSPAMTTTPSTAPEGSVAQPQGTGSSVPQTQPATQQPPATQPPGAQPPPETQPMPSPTPNPPHA